MAIVRKKGEYSCFFLHVHKSCTVIHTTTYKSCTAATYHFVGQNLSRTRISIVAGQIQIHFITKMAEKTFIVGTSSAARHGHPPPHDADDAAGPLSL